ncbi:hypothetical protein AB1Y20_021063 [Prymnesium parvum]|uniref:Uncharacterized protein n=1 Tax=Prymnesium parvum TaxID=97485 RepID=A0AB34JK96_PRYPA
MVFVCLAAAVTAAAAAWSVGGSGWRAVSTVRGSAAVPPSLSCAHSAAAPLHSRRAALGAAGGALLPFAAARTAQAELATSGALREDIGESVIGDGVQILLTDLTYKELNACPPNFSLPTKGGPWDCIEISATATNQGKRSVTAAAVFGIVRDAEGYPCLSTALDPTIKSGIASVGEVPKGSSPVSFVVAVQGRSPRPLRLTGFKASYRNAKIERTFEAFDPCEVDSSMCAEGEDQPSNAKALSQTGLFGAQY